MRGRRRRGRGGGEEGRRGGGGGEEGRRGGEGGEEGEEGRRGGEGGEEGEEGERRRGGGGGGEEGKGRRGRGGGEGEEGKGRRDSKFEMLRTTPALHTNTSSKCLPPRFTLKDALKNIPVKLFDKVSLSASCSNRVQSVKSL